MRRIIAALIIAAYPPWSHLMVSNDLEQLTIPGLFLLVTCALGIAYPGKRLSLAAWLLLASLVIATLAEWRADASVAHFLPSILIPAFLAFLFARTLRPGRKPLLTRFAQDVMNHRSEEVARYTRGVTLLWATVLSALALEAFLLAVFARPETWSLFTNGINYLIVIMVFSIELVVRRLRLGAQDGLRTFLKKLARTDLRRLG